MLLHHATVPTCDVRGLSKNYGAGSVVRDVTFSIHAGEVLGVLGPNGAGKSTIVRMITGLIEPTCGQVLFQGTPIAEQYETFRQGLGYVPEQADVYGFLSGWEFLELICSLRGLDRRTFRRRGLALFAAFGLADARNQTMSGYSKGMRQRVALMAALVHNPAFLVLDEPFSGLDITSGLILRELIVILAQRGKAIFFSSPSLEHLEQVCTRFLILRSGSAVALGSIGELDPGTTLANSFQAHAELVDPARTAIDIADITTGVGS